MATHSSVLAWRLSGMGEPGGLPSMGLHRVRHDLSDLAAAAAASQFYLQFLKESPVFSIVAVPVYIPTNSARAFLFSTSSPAFIVCRLFDGGHSKWCEVIFHCSFDFHFSTPYHTLEKMLNIAHY